MLHVEAARLPQCLLLLVLETLPLTPNGKVNRHALPAPGKVNLNRKLRAS